MNQFPHFDQDSMMQNIFGKAGKKAVPKQPVGGLRPKPAPGPAGPGHESEPLGVESTPVKEADKKPKVLLKNLVWGVDRASFNEKVNVELEADLPTELANITRIQIQVLAKTPDGRKEPIDKQETHLKSGKASGEVTLFYPEYREDGNLVQACDYVFTAKHRDSDEAESGILRATQPFATKVRWDKAEEWFGLPVKIMADTCLKDGSEVAVKVASENGVALDINVKAKKGRLEIPWTPCLCGVALDPEGKYPDKVEFYAELSHGEERAVPAKNFFLKVLGKTGYHNFSRDYTWGKFSVHSEFKQRIDQGAIDVRVEKPIIKAWPGYLLDLRTAGMKGTVEGCPYEGSRWGRIADNGELPNQYHDGKQWQPLPKKFHLDEDFITVVGLINQGGKFVECGQPSAIWPGQFEDYDFDSPAFSKKRQSWKSDTDNRWSRKFLIRPVPCQHGRKSGGCGYPLDLRFEMKKVEAWQEEAIAVCAGVFRSNAGCFSLEDDDIEMAAHEVGHLVGMPDEYEGGAIEPSINGDGAVNGIDSATIMGVSLDKVKRRQYANFMGVAEIQVSEKIGKKIAFIAADV